MKKVICGLVLLVSLVLSGCSNSENHSKTDEYKYDKATFESKYDLIFLSYFNMKYLKVMKMVPISYLTYMYFLSKSC